MGGYLSRPPSATGCAPVVRSPRARPGSSVVEQRTHNPSRAGSTPARATEKMLVIKCCRSGASARSPAGARGDRQDATLFLTAAFTEAPTAPLPMDKPPPGAKVGRPPGREEHLLGATPLLHSRTNGHDDREAGPFIGCRFRQLRSQSSSPRLVAASATKEPRRLGASGRATRVSDRAGPGAPSGQRTGAPISAPRSRMTRVQHSRLPHPRTSSRIAAVGPSAIAFHSSPDAAMGRAVGSG